MERLKGIPGETIESALKELCIKTGMDDKLFKDAFTNDLQGCFDYLLEFYKAEDIVKHVVGKSTTAKLKGSKRRRSKKKRSKKKRSKKKRSKKRRSRKY